MAQTTKNELLVPQDSPLFGEHNGTINVAIKRSVAKIRYKMHRVSVTPQTEKNNFEVKQ